MIELLIDIIGVPLLIGVAIFAPLLLFMYHSERNSIKAILFESDKDCQLVNIPHIKDGMVSVKGKAFTVDKANPFTFHHSFGVSPMYLLHHGMTTPVDINVRPASEEELTPTLSAALMDNKIYENITKELSENKAGAILTLIIGVIIGALAWNAILTFKPDLVPAGVALAHPAVQNLTMMM